MAFGFLRVAHRHDLLRRTAGAFADFLSVRQPIRHKRVMLAICDPQTIGKPVQRLGG